MRARAGELMVPASRLEREIKENYRLRMALRWLLADVRDVVRRGSDIKRLAESTAAADYALNLEEDPR